MNDFIYCNYIVFSQTDVLSAFNKLKLGKAAGPDGVSVECVNLADLLLSYRLADIFTTCCKHSVVLRNFYGGRITSIPKINSNSNFSHYRSVKTNNVFAKVYEYCL